MKSLLVLAFFSAFSHATAASCPVALLKQLNTDYLARHTGKEVQMWADLMGLTTAVPGAFAVAEETLRSWAADPAHAQAVAAALKEPSLDPQVREGLRQWQAFFSVNDRNDKSPGSGKPLKELLSDLIQAEEKLATGKKANPMRYQVPGKAEVTTTLSQARLIVTNEPDETLRHAVLDALYESERVVLREGFIPIVKLRNEVARRLGFADYYDWKVRSNEGMSKDQLFVILDSLESRTRSACEANVQYFRKQHGDAVLEPWNFSYLTRGSTIKEVDPYFPFSQVLTRFGETCQALGVDFQGASLTMDLVNRDTKWQNGFIRAPIPSYYDVEKKALRPAVTWFASNAVPGQVGSGHSAFNTVFHEGWHHANFSNIATPSVAGSQEESPTSIATAELQSMFGDSLLSDASWLGRYAKNEKGETIPWAVAEKYLSEKHRLRANEIRSMLVVPYMEKALYEMSDADLTPENILQVARDIERRMLFIKGSGRPVLIVQHLHSAESSAYYHGYVLAQLGVFMTREHFLKRDGKIVGNPKVAPDMAKAYWNAGNSVSFKDMIAAFTGEPFSADAAVRVIEKPIGDFLAQEKAAFDAAVLEAKNERGTILPMWLNRFSPRPRTFPAPIRLNGQFIVSHGDEQITSTLNGKSYETMAAEFAAWIHRLEKEAAQKKAAEAAGS